MTAAALSHTAPHAASSGGRLIALDGRPLALQGTEIRAEVAGGLARVVLEQRFRNIHPEPLRALYQVPLPADAAVSGYVFRIGDRRVVGEVDRRQAARERFEEALIEGRMAALLEQDRSSLFSQEIGNIPPFVEVVAEIVIDQRLRWLDEGAWEWRFPTVVAPRYLGAAGETPDAARPLLPRMHSRPRLPTTGRRSMSFPSRKGTFGSIATWSYAGRWPRHVRVFVS